MIRVWSDSLGAGLLDLLPVGVMVVDNAAPSGILINSSGARLLGAAVPEGEALRGFVPVPMDFRLFADGRELPADMGPLLRAARTGVAVPDWQGRLEDHSGRQIKVMISATPLFHESGAVRGAIAAIVDMSAHQRAEARQTLLVNELQYRVKSMLATVSALTMRMSRSGLPAEHFHSALLSRLAAMGRVQNLLTSSVWSGAGIRALIEAALEPYIPPTTSRDGGVVLAGADIQLSASAATTLGMAFHELATNAKAYGALSVPEGRLSVTWEVVSPTAETGPSLRLVWAEQAAPPPAADRTAGFGTLFLVRSVEYELLGGASLAFGADGLVATITFPLAGNLEVPEPG